MSKLTLDVKRDIVPIIVKCQKMCTQESRKLSYTLRRIDVCICDKHHKEILLIERQQYERFGR